MSWVLLSTSETPAVLWEQPILQRFADADHMRVPCEEKNLIEFGGPFNLVEETRHSYRSYIKWILRGSWAKQPQKQTVHCLGNPWWSIHTSLLPLACLCVFPCSRDTTQIIASSFPGSQSHRVLQNAHQRKHHQTPGLRMHHLYSKYYDIY